jgi:DNA-binding Xre family transcriptional regulator
MKYNFDEMKFRRLITDSGYKSENQFLEKTEMPRSTFHNIKKGKCGLYTVLKLCESLGCEVSDLFPSEKIINERNIEYVSKCKKISVFSDMTSIGVTTFSVNLAQLLEKKKYKTLIVEVSNSANFELLTSQSEKTVIIDFLCFDIGLKIHRHSPWLDSLPLRDLREQIYINENFPNSVWKIENAVDLSLKNLENIFESLIKNMHYEYIIFSCIRFPKAVYYLDKYNRIEGPEQFPKLSDTVIFGYDSHFLKFGQIELIIDWLSKYKAEVFMVDFRRRKRESFFMSYTDEPDSETYFDKDLYLQCESERKDFKKDFLELMKTNEKLHHLRPYISFFSHYQMMSLNRSIFSIDDTKLKSKVRSYKYQVKNIFDEIDSFERES